MRIIDTFLAELDQEAQTTRKFLESLPADQVAFKPHPKSLSAGQLAMHVATIPSHMSGWAMQDVVDPKSDGPEFEEYSRDEILAAFETSLKEARERLGQLDDARMMSTWTFQVNGKTLFTLPRVAMVRSWLMNHLYHHRGQFGVYLRLMGARVPSSYGPSGDENPMEQLMAAAAKG